MMMFLRGNNSLSVKKTKTTNIIFKKLKHGKKRSKRGSNALKIRQETLVPYQDPERTRGNAWPQILNHGFPGVPAYPRCNDPELRQFSDSFLQYNEAEGFQYSVSLDHYHWKKGNCLGLKEIEEFNGHVRRLDFSFHPYQVAFVKNKYWPDFCPGVDMVEIYENGKERNIEILKSQYQLLYSIATCRNLVAFVPSGITAGLGASMTFFAPLRGSTSTTDACFPQITYGYFPDAGATFFLPKLKGAIGMYLALTAKHLDKSDVFWAGLSCLTFDNDFMGVVDDIMHQYSRKGGEISEAARAVQMASTGPDGSKIDVYLEEINRCFGEQHTTLQSVFDALEAEGTDWSKRILQRMRSYSPVSLLVTFRMQRLGKYLKTIEEAFQLEYQVARAFLDSPDYWEGIKAKIIEKREPNWSYSSISEVPDSVIAKFFERQTRETLTLVPSHYGSTFNYNIRWFEDALLDSDVKGIKEAEPDEDHTDLKENLKDLYQLAENRSVGDLLNLLKKTIYEKELNKVAAGYNGFSHHILSDPLMRPDTAMTQWDKDILMYITRDEPVNPFAAPKLPPNIEEIRAKILSTQSKDKYNEQKRVFSSFNQYFIDNPVQDFDFAECSMFDEAETRTPIEDWEENEDEMQQTDVSVFNRSIEAMLHLAKFEDPTVNADDEVAAVEIAMWNELSLSYKEEKDIDPWDIVLFDRSSSLTDERLEQEQVSVEWEKDS